MDQTNDKGYTALHLAVLCGRDEVVELLAESGAKLNSQERLAQRTPLYDAVRLGYHGIVSTLLNGKADPNIPDIHGDTPIICAAKEGHIALVYLLARKGAKVDVISDDKQGVIACMRNKMEEIVQLLKSKGAPDTPVKMVAKPVSNIWKDGMAQLATESMVGIIGQAGKVIHAKKRDALAILKKGGTERRPLKGGEK